MISAATRTESVIANRILRRLRRDIRLDKTCMLILLERGSLVCDLRSAYPAALKNDKQGKNPLCKKIRYLCLVEGLLQKHVAYCTNAATNEEELFKSYKLNVVEQLLRTDNFYFTLLVLLLDGTLAGPQWIMLESYHRTLKAQAELKRILALYAKTGQLAGSLVFVEGSIDPIPDTWKHR